MKLIVTTLVHFVPPCCTVALLCVLSRGSGHHLGLIQLGEITVWSGRCRQSYCRVLKRRQMRYLPQGKIAVCRTDLPTVSSPCFCQAGLQVVRASCIFTPQTILVKITTKVLKKCRLFILIIYIFAPAVPGACVVPG